MSIHNDEQFKQVIDSLPLPQQRAVGAEFVQDALALSTDFRVRRAVDAARNPGTSDEELESAHRGAKAVAVETYTACGQDADWMGQAGHFVAAASAACSAAPSQLGQGPGPAWKAAMYVRMARTCEMIASATPQTHSEAERQYGILERFLQETVKAS